MIVDMFAILLSAGHDDRAFFCTNRVQQCPATAVTDDNSGVIYAPDELLHIQKRPVSTVQRTKRWIIAGLNKDFLGSPATTARQLVYGIKQSRKRLCSVSYGNKNQSREPP